MFYLIHFYKTLFAKPITGTLWVMTFLGLASTVFYEKNIQTFFGEQKTEAKNPYFYAVMPSDINTSYIQRKLKGLPGVESVYLLSKQSVGEQIKAILQSTAVEWDNELLNLDYAGIKVDLSPDLQGRSQTLIRNYLNRLAGDKDVTLGAVHTPLSLSKKMPTNWLGLLGQYIGLIFVGLSLVFLAMSIPSLGRESFLVETYQRKTKVFEKSFFYGQAPIIALLTGAVIMKGGIFFIVLGTYLVGMTILFSLGLKKRQWV